MKQQVGSVVPGIKPFNALLVVGVLAVVVGCKGTSLGVGVESGKPTDDELVRMSSLPWDAFRCAVVAPDDKETSRLIRVGLDAGREFLKACAGDAPPKKQRFQAISSKVPLFWTLIAYDHQSYDFALGQIYQQAADNVGKEIYEVVDGSFPPKELIDSRRENKYRGMNCVHIR